MKYNPDIHHRRSIRLKNYDYSRKGLYFISICTQNRLCLFGEVKNDEIILNGAGKTVEKCWLEIPSHFPHVTLDAFCIMPNHIHGILIIIEFVGAKNFLPLRHGTSKTIGSIVRNTPPTKNYGNKIITSILSEMKHHAINYPTT